MNGFDRLDDDALTTRAQAILAVVASNPGMYNTTAGKVSTADGTRQDLQSAVLDTEAKKFALKSSYTIKRGTRKTLLQQLNDIATQAYLGSATDEQLEAAGFAPRPAQGSRTAPLTPGTLTASGNVEGQVSLKWGSGGNKYGGTYVIEARPTGGEWAQVYATTRCNATVPGFSACTPMWFRVRAWRNNQFSSPSNAIPVFDDGSAPQQVAA